MNKSWQKESPRVMESSNEVKRKTKKMIIKHLQLCTMKRKDLINNVYEYNKQYYNRKIDRGFIGRQINDLLESKKIEEGFDFERPDELSIKGQITTLSNMIINIIDDPYFGGEITKEQYDNIINNTNYEQDDMPLALQFLQDKKIIKKDKSRFQMLKKVVHT